MQLEHNPSKKTDTRNYRSVTSQTLHYLSRPHSEVCLTPINSEAAWLGKDLVVRDQSWCVSLTNDDILEIEQALDNVKALGKATGNLSKEDFPLPTVSKKIAVWRSNIQNGRGFQVLQGVPVEKWGRETSEIFFWCFGLHLGIPGAQNDQGDLLGHIIDITAPTETGEVRLYKTNANIEYHCDAADVVGLLCLNKAKEGGKSRIVSSVAIYNEILKRRPDLIEVLYKPMLVDTHGEGNINYFPVVPCKFHEGKLRTFYHNDYFHSVRRYKEVPEFTAQERELLELYQEIASDPDFYMDMDLKPGDIQLLSNHTNLHARTDYIDHEDESQKRHLLRLWTSLPHEENFNTSFLRTVDKVKLVSGIIKEKIKHKFKT